MLLEETDRSPSVSKLYSNCPLKKRPVNVVKYDTIPPQVTPVIVCRNEIEVNEEPENLSTKPEDLSKTGKYSTKVFSSKPMGSGVKERDVLQVRSPLVPSPQNLYKAELELKAEPSSSWHTPVPHYPAYIPTLAYCSEPLSYRSSLYAGQFSPYYVRASSCSPPLYASQFSSYSPSSPTSPHTSHPSSPPAPEDLTSPGSVSSDSGVSACSVKKRRSESAPRYHCPDCDKSYSTYSGLTKHRQYHCTASENGVAKKCFSCKYCAKVYTSLGALKMHIRTHTLPCKCHLCGKAFSRPWLLQGHIRTHTGEKPFSCHHCRRAFADRSNLRAHLQTHSEVKKYSCTTCSKTFSRMSLLSKHAEGGCGAIGGLPPHYHFIPEEIHAY